METIKIKILLVLSILLGNSVFMFSQLVPNDLGTIEALINYHKTMKKAEDASLKQIVAIGSEQTMVTEKTSKYNKTMTTIHNRMNDVNSYLLLASRITKVTTEFKELIEDYTDFTTKTYNSAKEHPMAVALFLSANYKIVKEIDQAKNSILAYASVSTNLLKASMDEKYRLIGNIQRHVSNIKRIIWTTERTIKAIYYNGLKSYHIDDLLTEEDKLKISNKLSIKWKQSKI